MMTDQILLEMKHIFKTFPGVKALNNVDLSIRKGEIHALVGENGAGKSTLIKILSGFYTMDSGSIAINGQEVQFADALDAQMHGISTIHQELNMIPGLSVAENIFIGRELKRKGNVLINWRAIHEEARKLLKRVGMPNIDLNMPIKQFGTAVQQMVSIARALSIDSKVVIMDEPTSSLDNDEVNTLFQVMRNLQNQGISIIFISHRIDEIFQICERVTILKDGEMVGTYALSEISRITMVSKMIGRDATSILEAKRVNDDKVFPRRLTELSHASSENKVRNADIAIQQGQVVGLAGLLGSGRTEIARLFFGLDQLIGGGLSIKGKKVKLRSPRDAIRNKFAFCPENRRVDGIVGDMSVRENITLALLPTLKKFGMVDEKRQKQIVCEYIARLRIKTPNIDQPIKLLSGGNQQKVILARWMCMHPELIILDEPTRGIDVGAKQEIERLIKELAMDGISVLMISSEMSEIVRNSDRVDVIRDGEKVGELFGANINQDEIMNKIAEGGSGPAT